MFLKLISFLGQFITWLLTTPSGATVLSAVISVIMTFLSIFTDKIIQYAPLSYGFVAFAFFFLALIFSLSAGFIWTQISQRILTKKETFLEYKIENRRINLVKKSNIYKEPYCELIDQPEVSIATQTQLNRHQKRVANATGKEISGPTITIPKNLSCRMLVQFQNPVAPASFHVRIESVLGNAPTRESSSIDERWASVSLSNIPDNCSFRIRFN